MDDLGAGELAAAEGFGIEVGDAAGELRPVRVDDADDVAGVELAFDVGDARRQQALAVLAQRDLRALVDDDGALGMMEEGDPALKAYPPILAVAGLTDPRVTYWEPAKWVAKLRATKTDKNILMLKTIMTAGHGGASGRFARLKEVAEVYAFGLKITGAKNVD